MALVPAMTSFAGDALQYAANASVAAIVQRIQHEIAHLTPQQIWAFLARLLPGKKNAKKRKAVAQALSLTLRPLPNFKPNFGKVKTAALAYDVGVAGMAPRFRAARGVYTVANREFVSDIRGSITDALRVLEINAQPGIKTMFPWLSAIASTHQKYRFRKLQFNYVPVASASTNGRVTMAFAVDPLDPPVTSKQQLFQYHNSIEGSVWSPMTLTLGKELNGQLFTRIGAVDNTDLKTYDLGRLIVATSNGSNNNVIGELFVDYEVELSIPQPASCPSTRYLLTSTTNSIQISNLLPSSPIGVVELPGANWFLRKLPDNRTLIVFRHHGTYHITIVCDSDTGGAVGNISLSSFNGNIVDVTDDTSVSGERTIRSGIYTVTSLEGSVDGEVALVIGPLGTFTDIKRFEIQVSEFDPANILAVEIP